MFEIKQREAFETYHQSIHVMFVSYVFLFLHSNLRVFLVNDISVFFIEIIPP